VVCEDGPTTTRDAFDSALSADGDDDDGDWGEWVFEDIDEMSEDEGVEDTEKDPSQPTGDRDEFWDTSMLPLVAVVGRPNVGKSMIVNRLSRQYQGGSIVYDTPGITRDRTYRPAYWGEHEFRVVDTGGIVFQDDPDEVFLKEIRQQALVALGEAQAAVMVVDGQAGPTALDHEIAAFLRRQKLPVFLAVNKCESHTQGDVLAAFFWELGLGKPYPVSGIHGTGLAELLDKLMPKLDFRPDDAYVRVKARVAIVGRPNVGKSSLLNRLTGEERAIVSEVAGTTRDTIDSTVEFKGRKYVLVDTAGVRRRARVTKAEEKLMVDRALKAVRRSQVVLLLTDAGEGVTEQDVQLAELVRDAGAACVVVVNKWDLVDDERTDKLYRQARGYVQANLPPVAWASTLFVSAKTGFNAHRVYQAIDAAQEQHERRVSTALLNEVLQEAVQWQKPPSRDTGRQGKIYYCTQVGRRPPAIAIFVNDPSLFPDAYKRYLEGRFRDALGFEGTPVRLIFRGKRVREAGSNLPYAD